MEKLLTNNDNGILSDRVFSVLKKYESRLKDKFLSSDKEMSEAYKLRYKSFCEDLEWLPKNSEKIETDKYDEKAMHVGVYSNNKLITYCRIITNTDQFMINKEFEGLLDISQLKDNSIELSRLSSSDINYLKKFTALLLMYRKLYGFMIDRNLRYCYIVVTKDYLKTIKKIFPFKKVGQVRRYDSDNLTVAAVLDLRLLEDVFKNDEKLFSWFIKSQA